MFYTFCNTLLSFPLYFMQQETANYLNKALTQILMSIWQAIMYEGQLINYNTIFAFTQPKKQ